MIATVGEKRFLIYDYAQKCNYKQKELRLAWSLNRSHGALLAASIWFEIEGSWIRVKFFRFFQGNFWKISTFPGNFTKKVQFPRQKFPIWMINHPKQQQNNFLELECTVSASVWLNLCSEKRCIDIYIQYNTTMQYKGNQARETVNTKWDCNNHSKSKNLNVPLSSLIIFILDAGTS